MTLSERIDEAISVLDDKEKTILLKAEYVASMAHEDQTRNSGEAYISHPRAVVSLLKEAGVQDKMLLAAAWLHDVVEDTDVTQEDINKWFGNHISKWVDQLTTIMPNDCRPMKKHDVKRAMLISKATQMDQEAIYIKLADRLHNLRSMQNANWSEKSKKGYAKDGLLLAEALLNRYRLLINTPRADLSLFDLITEEVRSYIEENKNVS